MADVQQTYRFKFEFDRKDIKKQLNNISLDVKDAIAKMGDASDKVVIFKDLMTYLSNVDKALDMFKSKHKDDFANLFGNPDADLTKLLESIFDTTQQAASGFATLKDKIDAAAASNAKLETLKGIANEINELFVSVGKLPPIDIDKMFTGRGSKSAGTDFKGRIDLLNGALAEFGATYSGVQDKFKNGFNFGGTGGGSGSGMGDGGLSDFNEKIKKELNELEQQITELEQQKKKIQNIIRTLNGETINIKVNKKNDAEMLVDLINEYERLSAQLNDRAFRESASSNEYKKVKAERFDVASRLVHVASFVENEGSNMAGDIWTREHKVIDEAKAAMAEFRQHSQAEMQAIIKIFKGSEKSINSSIEGLSIEKYFKQFQQTTGIRDTITSVEQLVAVLNEYNRLSADPVDTDGLDTNSKKEALYDLLTNTNKLEENLGTVDDLLWNLNADNLDETANKLKEILGLKEKLASGTGKGGSDSGTESGDGDGTGTGSGDGKGNGPTEVDFSHLENTITTEAGRIVNKLGETLKVEIVKDSTGDSPEVEGVKSALTDMFDVLSQQSTREYKALLSGQNVYTKAGDSETISYKTSAEAYLSRFNKDIDLDVHSHQGLAASINTVDLESAIKRYYGGITKLSATIGGQDITTLDLTRVKAEDAYKALAKLEELVSKSKYKSVSAEQLNDIFSEINPKYLNVAQSWDPSQFGSLAQKIISIKQNSEQAITPLKRLKNIITVMSDGKVDLSKYEKLFKDFSVDKAAGIFNDIMQQEGITKDGQILQVDNTSVRYLGDVAEDIREQKIEFASLRQEAKLTYADIRNEAEKYLSTGDVSFFEKFFHPQDLNALYGAFADVEDQLMSIDALTDKIAGDFGIKAISDGASGQKQTDFTLDSTKLKESIAGLSGKVDENTTSIGNLTTAVEGLTAAMQTSDSTDDAERAQQVDLMKKNLLQVFDRVTKHNAQVNSPGSHTQQETSAEFFADGTARFGYAEDGSVPWKYTIEQLLSNIQSQSIMSLHSHPWGDFIGSALKNSFEFSNLAFANDSFSGSHGDLSAWKTIQSYGTQIGAMLTGNIIRTFDTSKIGDKYGSFISNLMDVEKEYAQDPRYYPYMSVDADGKRYYKAQNNLEDYHKVSDTFREVMFEALRRTGFSDTDTQGIYQEYDLLNDKQLTSLATTLVDLSAAAQTADSRVSALENLLKTSFGATNMRDSAIHYADVFADTIKDNDDTLLKLDAFDYVKNAIWAYDGNKYGTQLADIFNKYISDGKFEEAAVELKSIASTLGTDIESKDGRVALEALRKGEMSIADVWNRFSDFAEVSQDAIDKMQVIDAGQDGSAETNLMSQMAGSLSSIDNKVAAIEANTRPTMQDDLNSGLQRLMQLYNNGSEGIVFDKNKSLFDSDNITEFKAKELNTVAAQATEAFNDFLVNIRSRSADKTKPEDAQQLLRLYEVAVQRVNDALQQVSTYNSRYDTDITSDDTGEVIQYSLESTLERLTGSYSVVLESMIESVSGAKQNLDKQLGIQSSTSANRDEYYESDMAGPNDFLVECLNTLSNILNRLDAKLSVDTGSFQDQSVQTASQVANFENIDISSEISQCNDLIDTLQRVKAAVEAKTEAFEEEKATVNRVVVVEESALEELQGYVDTLRDSLKTLFENLPVDNTAFEAWKNDLITIKTNLDGILGNLREVSNLAPSGGDGIEQQAAGTDGVQPTSDYALDNTVLETNRILSNILGKLGDGSSFSSLVEPLKAATDELKNVSKGIIEEHKRKKVDTRDADARLADPATVEEIKKAALNAVSGKVVEGGMMDVTDMTAMADGAVRVSGYVQTAADKWEGFTLQVNKANEASKTAYSVNAKAAKEAQKMAEEAARAAKETEKVADNAGAAPKTMDQVAEQYKKKSKERELQKITGQVNLEKGSLGFNFNARNLEPEQDAIVKAYDKLIAEMDKYEINVKNGQQDTLNGIEREKKALFDLIDAYKIKNNIVNAGRTGNKKAYGATIVKNATSKYNALSNAASTEELKNSDVAQQALAKYTAAYQELVRLQSQYKVGQVLSADEEQEFNDARIACNNYAKELDKLLKVYQKSQEGAHHYEFGGDFEDTVSGRQKALKEFLEETYGASATFEKFDKDFNTMIYTVDNGDGTFTRMTASINNTRTAIDATAGEAKKATGVFASFWNELKGKFKSIGSYLIASFSFQEVIQVVRQGITYVREIDSALTELKKVTNETDAAYDQFLQDMSKTGSVVGATVADLTTMASEWARLGYSMEEAGKLAESTAVLLNVSEFESATEASEALISTMQAFQYTADESQHVVDILNEVKVTCLLIQ